MTFEKKLEIIERTQNEWGFVLITKLAPNENMVAVPEREIIAEIIKSSFHSWGGQGEIYGFYDNSKLKAEHYKRINFEEFYLRLTVAINDETDYNTEFAQRVMDAVKENLKTSFTYYFLNLDPKKNESLRAFMWIYDFFYAFVAFDWISNCVFLIEFGMD